MIRNEREYKQALSRLENDRKVLEAQRRALAESGLSEEEVEWYERVRRREFAVFHDVRDIGRTLIALRIANGMSQRELAERLGVSEAQISRDERDEYHSITVERVQRILDVMGESLRMQVEDKPLVIA